MNQGVVVPGSSVGGHPNTSAAVSRGVSRLHQASSAGTFAQTGSMTVHIGEQVAHEYALGPGRVIAFTIRGVRRVANPLFELATSTAVEISETGLGLSKVGGSPRDLDDFGHGRMSGGCRHHEPSV